MRSSGRQKSVPPNTLIHTHTDLGRSPLQADTTSPSTFEKNSYLWISLSFPLYFRSVHVIEPIFTEEGKVSTSSHFRFGDGCENVVFTRLSIIHLTPLFIFPLGLTTVIFLGKKVRYITVIRDPFT